MTTRSQLHNRWFLKVSPPVCTPCQGMVLSPFTTRPPLLCCLHWISGRLIRWLRRRCKRRRDWCGCEAEKMLASSCSMPAWQRKLKVYLSCIKYDKIFYLIPEMEKACMFYSSSRIGMPLVALVEQVQGSRIGWRVTRRRITLSESWYLGIMILWGLLANAVPITAVL